MSEFTTKDAYQTYVTYLALKRHFTSNYDYFKYGGKTNASLSSFESRKDKYFFYRLSKDKDAHEIILANMVADPNVWIGDLVNDEKYTTVFKEWKKRQQSLSYTFNSELNELDENFDSNFIVKNGQHPKIIRLYMGKKISLETLIILTDLTKCHPYWQKNISDTIIWPDINKSIENYRGFLTYDRDKLKKLLLDKFAI